MLENYEEYAKHARLMTSIHAQLPKRYVTNAFCTMAQNSIVQGSMIFYFIVITVHVVVIIAQLQA